MDADAKEKDEDDFTLLMLASYLDYRTSEIIPALIAAGADVNAKDDDDVTALMVAASRGADHAAKQLLAGGARVEDHDLTGRTASDYAKASKDEDVINLITDAIRQKKALASHAIPTVVAPVPKTNARRSKADCPTGEKDCFT